MDFLGEFLFFMWNKHRMTPTYDGVFDWRYPVTSVVETK